MAEPNDGSIEIDVDDPATVQVAGDDDNTPNLETQKVAPKVEKEPRTRTRKASPDPLLPEGPTPDQALAEAQAYAKQQEDARRAAEATAASERQRADHAESARQAALKQAEEHAERASNTELNLIESRIASETSTLSALQDAYEKAAEAGEFKKMAELQTKMSRAASALDRFEAAKAEIEANPRQPSTEGAVTAPQPSSPVEQHLAGYAPAAQTWLRQHLDCLPPQFGGDSVKNSKMMAGHYSALAKGFSANSEPYFKEIETHLNPAAEPIVHQPTSKAAEVTPAVTHRAPPAPSAPPSREAPQASGAAPRNARSVTLSKEQQEMARMSFPHMDEKAAYGLYARNLLELEAEGKIGRLTH